MTRTHRDDPHVRAVQAGRAAGRPGSHGPARQRRRDRPLSVTDTHDPQPRCASRSSPATASAPRSSPRACASSTRSPAPPTSSSRPPSTTSAPAAGTPPARRCPTRVLEELRGHDAILLGAVGDPAVPSGVLERGLLLRLRFALDHHVNLRPARLYPGVDVPAGRSQRHRLRRRPRGHRGPVRRQRRRRARGHAARDRHRGQHQHGVRRRAGRARRLPARAAARRAGT